MDILLITEFEVSKEDLEGHKSQIEEESMKAFQFIKDSYSKDEIESFLENRDFSDSIEEYIIDNYEGESPYMRDCINECIVSTLIYNTKSNIK